jgi:hypothetical protein
VGTSLDEAGCEQVSCSLTHQHCMCCAVCRETGRRPVSCWPVAGGYSETSHVEWLHLHQLKFRVLKYELHG